MRKNLIESRKSSGLTQAELARQLKITTRQYQHIESGKTLGKVDMWDMLEDLFGLPQRQLREISESPRQDKVKVS